MFETVATPARMVIASNGIRSTFSIQPWSSRGATIFPSTN
jgi:hypothetical protein